MTDDNAAGSEGIPNGSLPAISLWATNVGQPVRSLDDWIDRLARQARIAADSGHGLLVLPEYACAQWLHLPDAPKAARDEIPWMAELAADAAPAVARTASDTGIDILAGSWPWQSGGGDTAANRALFCRPDGTAIAQDKLTLTPGERDPAAWTLTPGRSVAVFDWHGWRTAIVICLDIEQPSLAALLAPLDIDLILVPSMTAAATGYHRVHSCARARAVEMMTVVATVGTIGTLPDGTTNHGGAAVYGPCEPGLSDDGLLIGTGRLNRHDGEGPVLSIRDLPLAAVRAMRHGDAEVWPGPWDATEIAIRHEP